VVEQRPEDKGGEHQVGVDKEAGAAEDKKFLLLGMGK
jgi:hypothetical protein